MSAEPKMRAICPTCGRRLSVAPPSRGDGSVDVFPRHPPGKWRCAGSRTDVAPKDYVGTGGAR